MGQTAENLAYRFGITRAGDGRVRGAQPPARARRAEGRALRRRGRAALRRAAATLYASRRRRARGFDGREPREAQAVLRPQVRQRHRRQQLAGHRRRGVARARVGARGRRAQAHAAAAASSTRSGPGSIRRRWASAPCYAATPLLAAPRPRPQRPRRVGDQRSVRRAGPRLRARLGKTTTSAASELGLPGALGDARRRPGSTSTAARSRSAIRSARRARASCCTCSTCSSAPAASAAWPRSASAAAWAARCSSSGSDEST